MLDADIPTDLFGTSAPLRLRRNLVDQVGPAVSLRLLCQPQIGVRQSMQLSSDVGIGGGGGDKEALGCYSTVLVPFGHLLPRYMLAI